MFSSPFLFLMQVLVEKEYVSCCVRIQESERSVIAVPKPGTFSDPEIQELEATSVPGKLNLPLLQKLHALSGNMKEELQTILISKGVQEGIKFLPVKRSYAFERPDIPRGEGYFVELNYPYKYPPLEADLSGKHFGALFGTHTSALELLLLQRELMGPGWLLISSPQRVASSGVSRMKAKFQSSYLVRLMRTVGQNMQLSYKLTAFRG